MAAELRKILHVDDDDDIRAIAQIALETVGGFELQQCDCGRKAIEVAPGFQPDLLLLDVMMPEMDGETTLRRLRTIPGLEETPAIFMTAKAQADSQAELRRAGAADIIVKPFDPMALATEIRAIWDRVQG